MLRATSALRREQINLQVALIAPLIHLKGYAARETIAAVERARQLIEQAEALGEPPEDPLMLYAILYGVYVTNLQAFNGNACRDVAKQFLALAESQGATVPLMMGHRIVGISLLLTGEFAESRAHLDRAFALYDPAEHSPLTARFGQDHGVTVLSFRSVALWSLGYPDAALRDADRALREARRFGQAATLMVALGTTALTQLACGNYAAAGSLADELLALAEEKSAAYFKAVGTLLQGDLLALTGKGSAIQTISSALAALRSTGATLFIPGRLSTLARAYANLGRFDDAWRSTGEAMTAADTTKERWWDTEINRVAGEIALKQLDPDVAKAEEHFDRALSVARQQQAKSWELRAAMSLARLWRSQGKTEASARAACSGLRVVYGGVRDARSEGGEGVAGGVGGVTVRYTLASRPPSANPFDGLRWLLWHHGEANERTLQSQRWTRQGARPRCVKAEASQLVEGSDAPALFRCR